MIRTQHHLTALAITGVSLAAVVGLTACSSSGSGGTTSPSTTSSSSSSGGSASTASDSISIKNFMFSPMSLTVQPGAKVSVTNNDTTTHTLTAQTASQFNTMDIAPGKTVSFTAPSKAGSYPYICDIHQYMKGTLVVK